jgi:hypothetical protein
MKIFYDTAKNLLDKGYVVKEAEEANEIAFKCEEGKYWFYDPNRGLLEPLAVYCSFNRERKGSFYAAKIAGWKEVVVREFRRK